jgi:predicted nucleic acid-binding protein
MKKEDVVLLRDLNADLLKKQTAIKEKRSDFEETIKSEVEDCKNISLQIDQVKNVIKSAALDEFKSTGEKKLLGGIGIRETQTLEYDSGKAFMFAKEKDMFLTLDDKAFKKAAPSLNLDFVTVTKISTVTFPKEIKL